MDLYTNRIEVKDIDHLGCAHTRSLQGSEQKQRNAAERVFLIPSVGNMYKPY